MEIKPCPFCGHKYPWTFITAFVAVLRCQCGATMEDAAVRVLYKRDELPEQLKDHTYEPELLVIKDGDRKIPYPDHGYIGVNVIAAFAHSGVLARWNARRGGEANE
jgi:hypothetical protein